MSPVITTVLLVLIWVVVLNYKHNHVSRVEKQRTHEFWQKERESNHARKKDISSLPYIQIPIDTLPFSQTSDSVIQEYQDIIKELANAKILNLNGISNTELKLQFGPANLESLIEYDQNFTQLIQTLAKWGERLYEQGNLTEAKTILEYGITCKTEIKNNYILLANIYKAEQEFHKINELIETANSLSTLMKSSIISSLQAIQNSNSIHH